MNSIPWLTLLIVIPVLGAVALAFVRESSVRWTALGVTCLEFLVSLPLWFGFDALAAGMQFTETALWIPSPAIYYRLGVDGISLPLVLMTTFLLPLCVMGSWRSVHQRIRGFMAALLITEAATIGVFVALDFVLFYVFWEAVLIPMYLLIGVWGGPNRLYAAIKFFLYTLAGSVLLLIAIIFLYFQSGQTFDILTMGGSHISPTLQAWLFWAFFAAFAVKVPMWPFHTWLPDAHVEAPTAGSVLLASVLLKMGTYGFLRLTLPILPDASAQFANVMIALSLVAIVYGAYMALAQGDMKKLIAYSSVSHMGFVTLGLFTFTQQGIEGAVLQMVNHGITTGALFLCVGAIYERTHSRLIVDNAGLAGPMPRYATFLVIFSLSSLGLPGTNSFAGEFLVLVGTFVWSKLATSIAALGVILAAAYMLWLVQRVAFGPAKADHHLHDLGLREMLTMAPLVVAVFWIGFVPNWLLRPMHLSVERVLAAAQNTKGQEARPPQHAQPAAPPTRHPELEQTSWQPTMRTALAVSPTTTVVSRSAAEGAH